MSGVITVTSGPGLVISGVMAAASRIADPSFVMWQDLGGTLALYPGTGGATATWTNVLTTTARGIGVDTTNSFIYATDDNGNLRKIDYDGNTEWTVDTGTAQIHGPRIATDPSGDVYVGYRTGGAAAIEKRSSVDGSIVWSSVSGPYSGATSIVHSAAESAIYVGYQAGHAAGLVKYSDSTGAELWNKNSGDVLVSSAGAPASPTDVTLLPNGNVALATTGWTGSQNRGHFWVLNASTGAQIVKADMTATANGGTLAVDDTHAFISAGSVNDLYAWEHDGTFVDTLSGVGIQRPIGTRASTSQVYIADPGSGDVKEVNISGSTIVLGTSIATYSNAFTNTHLGFID